MKKGCFEISISYPACGNCGACVAVCPEYVLHLNPIMLVSNHCECTGCKWCIMCCPADALRLVDISEKGND